MSFEEADDPRVEQRKLRTCLSCNGPFESEWAGERICRRCKGTSSWRGGGSKAGANHAQYHSRSRRGSAS